MLVRYFIYLTVVYFYTIVNHLLYGHVSLSYLNIRAFGYCKNQLPFLQET